MTWRWCWLGHLKFQIFALSQIIELQVDVRCSEEIFMNNLTLHCVHCWRAAARKSQTNRFHE